MIIGADPKAKIQPKNLRNSSAVKLQQQVSEVCMYFDFKSRLVEARTISDYDRPTFRSHVKRMLSSGIDRRTMKRSIDAFFSESRYQTNPCPWKAFVSTKVQTHLMQKTGGSVNTTDPVLQWVLNDFDRDGIDIFWPESDDREIRNLFFAFPQVVYRYPELLVELLNLYTLPEIRSILVDVDDLIETVLANGRAFRVKSALLGRGVPLPTGIASQTTLRPKAPTLAIAIARSQR